MPYDGWVEGEEREMQTVTMSGFAFTEMTRALTNLALHAQDAYHYLLAVNAKLAPGMPGGFERRDRVRIEDARGKMRDMGLRANGSSAVLFARLTAFCTAHSIDPYQGHVFGHKDGYWREK